jgi:hypothetical protein
MNEMVHQINFVALKKCKELEEVINEEHIELDMRKSEINLL